MEQSPSIDALLLRLKELEQMHSDSLGTSRFGSSTVIRSDRVAAFEAYERLLQWKYEHPVKAGILRAAYTSAFLALVFVFLWWLAGLGAGEAVGLKPVRERLTNAYYGVLWSTRSSSNSPDELPITPTRLSGSIERVIGDVLVVVVYDGKTRSRRLVRLANVIVTNKPEFGKWASQYLLKGVVLDFYKPLEQIKGHDVWGAVIWHRRVPINVQPVEHGIGIPEKNPPTTVVNQIFSQYYWSLAKG